MTEKTNRSSARRWHALALAALVLAGGSLAVPQTADAAAAKQHTCNYRYTATCVLTTKVSGVIHFRVKARVPHGKSLRYAVTASGGKTLCSGRIKADDSLRMCFFSYSGTVRVAVTAPAMTSPRITAY